MLALLGYMFENSEYPMFISEWMGNGSVGSYMGENPNCDILNLVRTLDHFLLVIWTGVIHVSRHTEWLRVWHIFTRKE